MTNGYTDDLTGVELSTAEITQANLTGVQTWRSADGSMWTFPRMADTHLQNTERWLRMLAPREGSSTEVLHRAALTELFIRRIPPLAPGAPALPILSTDRRPRYNVSRDVNV